MSVKMELLTWSQILVLAMSLKMAASGTDMMGASVLERSKNCIKAAQEAYTQLQKGSDDASASGIITHLETLLEDGKYLQKSTEGFLSKLAAQEQELDKKFQQLTKDKARLQMEVDSLKKEKSSVQGTYSAKQSVLMDNEKQLKTAQTEKKNAEDELNRAKKKAKKKKSGLFGKIRHGLNKLVGHVSGADKRVKTAKNNLARRQNELTAAKNAVTQTKQSLDAVQSQINQKEAKIRATKQEADKKHDEIGLVKKSIVFVEKSVHFWELFVVAARNAEERTTNLKKVVDLASEKMQYELLRADGTITRAKSFIEAWEMISTDPRIN